MIDLIYCASGNERFMQIAVDAGFKYGAQFPGTVYGPVYFADQNWKKPDREKYMRALEKYRPCLATVLDWEHEGQLDEVLDWANEAAQWVGEVVIIPKVIGGILQIPRGINGKPVRLGYSVPTKYAGTPVPIEEFAGWPIHLLGGSPHKQMELVERFDEVRSVDGNYMQKMATRFCQFWVPGTAKEYARNRWWPTLKEADGKRWDGEGTYEAFRRSCENIMRAWKRLSNKHRGEK